MFKETVQGVRRMQLGRDAHGFQYYANVLCIKLHSRHMEVRYFVFYTFQMCEIVIIKMTSEMASNNTSKWEGRESSINNFNWGLECIKMSFFLSYGYTQETSYSNGSWKGPWIHQHFHMVCELVSFSISYIVVFGLN